MRFLKQLLIFLQTLFSRSDWLPRSVGPSERVTRYLVSKNHFRNSGQEVGENAFHPNKKTQDISVYRTTSCTADKIESLGMRCVTSIHKDKKPILGWADLLAQDYSSESLIIAPFRWPHPRHANVKGWPEASQKAVMKLKAQKLAGRVNQQKGLTRIA